MIIIFIISYQIYVVDTAISVLLSKICCRYLTSLKRHFYLITKAYLKAYYTRGKCKKYKTCSYLFRFHILHNCNSKAELSIAETAEKYQTFKERTDNMLKELITWNTWDNSIFLLELQEMYKILNVCKIAQVLYFVNFTQLNTSEWAELNR